MPITPFHFGPGIFFKSILPKYFSIWVFIFSQVVIDAEVAWNMFQGNDRWHTFFHTYLGSLSVVAICFVFFRWIWGFALRLMKENKIPIFTPTQILGSALIGAWSHIFLDSLMHADMEPFWPFSTANGLLNQISLSSLHLLCIGAGLAGGLVYGVRLLSRSPIPPSSR